MFRDNTYPRVCPACSHTSPGKAEWDDTPQTKFCPICGVPMGVLACAACDAPLPLMSRPNPGPPGGYMLRPPDFCTQCGVKTEGLYPHERSKSEFPPKPAA